MKNIVKLFGNLNRARSAKVPLLIIALVTVIGFSMAGCDTGGGGGTTPGGTTPGDTTPGDSKGWITVTNQPFYFDDSNVLNDSSSLTLSSIQTIAYGNGKFVAGGYYIEGASTISQMASSSDGINWTVIASHPFNGESINYIVFGNDIFVAVGHKTYTPKIAYSSDGINWTASANSTFGNQSVSGIAFGNGMFVIVGSSAVFASPKIAYSSDGETWTAIPAVDNLFSEMYNTSILIGGIISGIIYGNGKFVAGSSYGRMAYLLDN